MIGLGVNPKRSVRRNLHCIVLEIGDIHLGMFVWNGVLFDLRCIE